MSTELVQLVERPTSGCTPRTPREATRSARIRRRESSTSASGSHGIENVYVCGASVFPSSVTVNPQLTVMALADYAAADIE
jgi:glycine/D-amino acid oxidase-like deaminating enzyme